MEEDQITGSSTAPIILFDLPQLSNPVIDLPPLLQPYCLSLRERRRLELTRSKRIEACMKPKDWSLRETIPTVLYVVEDWDCQRLKETRGLELA